jgi:RNA polymerase sigma-70 factor, ECF subfamily
LRGRGGDLVGRAVAGDRDALDALLREHYDRVYALCLRMTGNEADALDACQEALLAIVRGLPRFDGRSAFPTWAYRVATNACLDELRRRRRRPLANVDDMSVVERRNHPEDAADRVDVQAALARLPIDFRSAVVLRDLAGLSYDEIAETLDVPPGTVRSRIARGRAALAADLGGIGNGEPDPPRRRPTPDKPRPNSPPGRRPDTY